jgi:hypothetical protein
LPFARSGAIGAACKTEDIVASVRNAIAMTVRPIVIVVLRPDMPRDPRAFHSETNYAIVTMMTMTMASYVSDALSLFNR